MTVPLTSALSITSISGGSGDNDKIQKKLDEERKKFDAEREKNSKTGVLFDPKSIVNDLVCSCLATEVGVDPRRVNAHTN